MAADTKIGAPDYVTVEWHNGREGVAISVARLREQLAVQGLHVVTAADKADVIQFRVESRVFRNHRDQLEKELSAIKDRVSCLLDAIRSLPDTRLRNELCDAFYGAAK